MYVPAADELLITKVYPLAYASPDDPKHFPHYLPPIEKENGVGRVNINSPMYALERGQILPPYWCPLTGYGDAMVARQMLVLTHDFHTWHTT